MNQTKSRSALKFSLATALIATSGCMLTDMHDATMGMQTTTDGMSKTTCVMYRSLRQGNAKVSRDKDFDDIRNAENIAGRLAEAAEYMQGFEYQVWSPTCIGEVSRDVALEQSVRELLTKIQGFIGDRSEVSATKTSKNFQVLYAFAATLHYVNPLQADLLTNSGLETLRPLDLLVKGLEMDQLRNRGEISEANIPTFVNIVGKYRKEAEFLLRIRSNFLMAYAYSHSDSDSFGNSPNSLNKIWRIGTSGLMNRSWKPKLDATTQTIIEEKIILSLKYAIETRESLIRLGIDPMTDENLVNVWKNADFSAYDLDTMDKSSDKEVQIKSAAIRELIEIRDRLLK